MNLIWYITGSFQILLQKLIKIVEKALIIISHHNFGINIEN
jgi:hypothetical protein